MQPPGSSRRKQRTREHVIDSVSINYVERHIYESGHTVERVESDYGYDLIMFTFDNAGRQEVGNVFIQVKATDHLALSETKEWVECRVNVADYNMWRDEGMPVFLIIYDAKKRLAHWLYVQQYFEENPDRGPHGDDAQTVSVRIPVKQRWNRRAVALARRFKQSVLDSSKTGGIHHD
jgi:hypothetical protein